MYRIAFAILLSIPFNAWGQDDIFALDELPPSDEIESGDPFGDFGNAVAVPQGADDQFDFFGEQTPEQPPRAMRLRNIARVVIEEDFEPVPQGELEVAAQIRVLKEKVRESNPEDRQTVVSQLKTLLEKIFDADVAKREEHLGRVEARIAALREKLEKYKSAKERLIHLQVEQVSFEADGIRFPDFGGEQNRFQRRTSTSPPAMVQDLSFQNLFDDKPQISSSAERMLRQLRKAADEANAAYSAGNLDSAHTLYGRLCQTWSVFISNKGGSRATYEKEIAEAVARYQRVRKQLDQPWPPNNFPKNLLSETPASDDFSLFD